MPIHVSYLAEEIDDVAPGVRIIVPMDGTPQAQRGSFCALVDLQGVPNADALVERMLSAMQRTYYSERGTQSQVTAQTVRVAQTMIANETQRMTTPWRAGVVCVSVMADRLALTGMGSAFALLTAEDGSVGVFPPDRLSAHAAGAAPTLSLWPLHRQKISAMTAMIAGSGEWLNLVSVRTLAATAAYVDAGSCIDAAEGLREQAGHGDAPGMIMVIDPDTPSSTVPPAGPPTVPPTDPNATQPSPSSAPSQPPHAPSASTGAVQARSLSTGGLPTALNASPPLVSTPIAGGDEETATRVDASRYQSTASQFPEQTSTTAPPSARQTPEVSRFERTPNAPPDAAAGGNREATSDRFAARARTGLNQARSFLESMLPERGETIPTPVMAEAAAMSAPAFAPTPTAPPKVRPAAEPFIPPAPATGSRARILIAGAVILLLLVPAIVATLYWRQNAEGSAEADVLVNLAEARYATATQALDQEDTAVARAMLTEATTYLRRAEEISGRTERTNELLALIDRDRQAVESITLLYGLTLPLISFEPDMAPQQVMVMGQDIYLLDAGRNEILSYRLGADGESLAAPEGSVVLRMGDTINGVTVGALLDLAWQPPVPGYDDKSSLLVLDDNNQVFRYNQQVDGASVVNFGGGAPWERATQIETFLGRLYVADEGANQIYRYDVGRYDQPTPWFQAPTQVNLANLSTMRIDGDIWLLYQDGKVVRYRSGEQLPYSLDSSIALPAQATDLWVGQDGDEAIYLVDSPIERILVFAKESGAYLEQFQAAENAPLSGLQGLFIDRSHSTQYLLTDSNLYQESLPR